MKKTINYILPVLLLLGSCKKYLDINQNPNAAEEPPINGLLANTTYETANNVFNVSDRTSYYVQYLASPNASSASDTYDAVNPNTAWDGIYNTLTDLYDLKKFAAAKGLNSYIGVADILLAFHLNLASNLWGDLPYSEAFVGVQNLTPKFDNQQAIFDTAINLIDAGIAILQSAPADELNTASDFIHAGKADAWIKTAHALKARMLNQLSKTPDYNASNILTEIAGAYTSYNDDAQVTSFQVRNPWKSVAIANAGLDLDGWLSSYFVNAADGATYGVFDPRLPLITDKTKFGDYRGTDNGKGRIGSGTEHEECYIDVDKWYSSDNSPLEIITDAECRFIEAEAQFRGGHKTEAYAAYMSGIEASLKKMGVADTAYTRYTTSSTVAVGADNITLALILKEKYIACFLNPVTWDDMRRNDYAYKNFKLPANAVLSDFIRRIDYPTDETSRNGKNVPDVLLSDHLWWDK